MKSTQTPDSTADATLRELPCPNQKLISKLRLLAQPVDIWVEFCHPLGVKHVMKSKGQEAPFW